MVDNGVCDCRKAFVTELVLHIATTRNLPSSTVNNALSKPSAGAIPRTELEDFRLKSLSMVPGQVADGEPGGKIVNSGASRP